MANHNALGKQWHLAAEAVTRAIFRLGITLKAYNPNQQRVPAGQPGAGQWVGENGQNMRQRDPAKSPERIAVAQYEKRQADWRDLIGFWAASLYI
jgi:hypothetical protein